MTRKAKLLLLLLIAAGIFFVVKYFKNNFKEESPAIRISGNIEVTDAQVSFKVSGRVEKRLVDEGEIVKQGQLVALLVKTELEQEVASSEAEVRAATANLNELLAGSRPEEIAQARATYERAQAFLRELQVGSRPQEIAAARATVYRAHADMENLRIEWDRYRKLYKDGVISEEKVDLAETKYQMAKAQFKEAEEKLKLTEEGPRKEDIEQARAALKEAKEYYNLVKKGPRKETIEQSKARLEKVQATLALAKTRLSYTDLYSPLTGVVLSKNIEAGEYVTAGTPIITVGNLENVWVRGYVNETDLGRIKVGQNVRVTADTYPEKIYEGRLSFISSEAEFTPKSVQTKKERVKLVYRVKIDINNPKMELKPGMPADAEILLQEIDNE